MTFLRNIIDAVAQTPSIYQFFYGNSKLSESISRLEATLIVASQLIERSECWCFKYENIGKLLSYLKNAVYEAELTIEDFKYQRRTAENNNWNYTGARAASAPSSSDHHPEMELIEQTSTTAQGAIDSAAPSAPATIPAHHHMPSIETQTTDDPSSSSPRNRKADAQN